MSLVHRADPAPLSASALLAEVARLYKALQALPGPQSQHGQPRSPAHGAIEAQIRALSERVWAFENENGDPIVGQIKGRKRPYLVLRK